MTPETFKKCIQDLFYGKKPPAGHISKIRIGEEVETLTFPKFNEAEQAALYVKRPEGNFISFNGVDYELIPIEESTFVLYNEYYPDFSPHKGEPSVVRHASRPMPSFNQTVDRYTYTAFRIAGEYYAFRKIKSNQ